MNGIFLTTDSLNRLRPDSLSDIFTVTGIAFANAGPSSSGAAPAAAGAAPQSAGVAPVIASGASTDANHPDYLARFNERQARQLLRKPIHPTSKRILEVVAELGPRFRVGDALDKLGLEMRDLRYALSGLTRRTRKIANDDEVILFNAIQEADDPRDSISEIHPETCAALRRVLSTGA
jgi:hypothetical protein